jgi:hypothetical protein
MTGGDDQIDLYLRGRYAPITFQIMILAIITSSLGLALIVLIGIKIHLDSRD